MGFSFWRKGRLEHHNEYQLFDAFVLASLTGWLVARIAYIIFHFNEFGFNIISYFDLVSKPGFSLAVFGVSSMVVLSKYAKKHDWNVFEILDFWAMSLSVGMIVLALGWFVAGINFGNPTQMPWGINFPSVFDKRQPTQVFASLAFALILVFMVQAEYKYRTFKWYKGSRSSAQSGFLFSFFLISSGAFWFLISFFKLPQVVLFNFGLDWLLGLSVSVVGIVMLLARQGRIFPTANRRRSYDSRTIFKGKLD